jgi:hypothetical protein
LPDKLLLEAAARGELRTEEQVAAQAQRMTADPRAWFKLRAFLHQWLHVERIADLSKDASAYPDFDAQVVDGPSDVAGPVPGRSDLGERNRFPQRQSRITCI